MHHINKIFGQHEVGKQAIFEYYLFNWQNESNACPKELIQISNDPDEPAVNRQTSDDYTNKSIVI